VNKGFTDAGYWFMFEYNTTDQPQTLPSDDIIIEINYPHLDLIQFYKTTASPGAGIEKQLTLGDSLPFHQRPIIDNVFAIPDQVKPGESYRYWFRISSTSAIQFNLTLWERLHYFEVKKQAQAFYGFYFGILFVMAIYNFFIGLATKDRAYFYYCAYIVGFFLMQLCLWGYAYQYLWPGNPNISNYANPNINNITLALASAFARNFLRTRERSPVHDKLLLGIICIFIGTVFTSVLYEYRIRMMLTLSGSLFMIFVMLHASYTMARKGQQSAKLFLAAWLTILIGGMIYDISMLGIIPTNVVTQHAMLTGSALEVILLSFALADRINRTKAEKRAIERDAKIMLQQKNRELESALNEVRRINKVKDEFLATISHELRTPMNGIEGSLQVVRHSPGDQSAPRHIDAAFYSAQHMAQLVDSLLEYSELQSGNWKLSEKPFDIQKILDRCINSVKQGHANKDLTFNFENSSRVDHYLIGDGDRLQHLIYQLLDNAFKFTPRGSVTLRLKAQRSQPQDDCKITIEVEDTGIGIEAAELEKIYEGFRQIDGSFKRQYGGLGIGLSICKAITDQMNAELTVNSRPGEGTLFRFQVTLAKGNKLPPAPGDNQPFSWQPEILVVEDNSVNQMMLVAMLKKLNCAVTTAVNGKEAVELARAGKFDAILMDCQMPVMDGFEATGIIRQPDNTNCATPIIAVTANTMSGDRERCLAGGMDDYIKKPINVDVIRQRLVYWLENNPARAKQTLP
ncbi:MAG: 7TM diverse intracellular signaling domain-containing protein, partial [Ketobacteraceae bacterium]|nr:7TM diverse intracellular signaling domain-containing protein [Ketobacteraceae bacterium]